MKYRISLDDLDNDRKDGAEVSIAVAVVAICERLERLIGDDSHIRYSPEFIQEQNRRLNDARRVYEEE